MKILLIFVLVGCATSFAKVCKCDNLSIYYKSVGCKSICRRGSCSTIYSCSNVEKTINSKPPKCYFKGNFYTLGHQLPIEYPTGFINQMCNYTCSFAHDLYHFVPNDCSANRKIPSPELCRDKYELKMPFLTKSWYPVMFQPEKCNLEISVPTIDLPPNNCSGRKCCIMTDKKYKIGTVITESGRKYECLCPPFMTFEILK
ncbi:hypothetical protein FQR65_LT13801 [Abscondita terminalis]|nr:hypothetical protein FQR65_LT13801 [Abscondita terminalis]